VVYKQDFRSVCALFCLIIRMFPFYNASYIRSQETRSRDYWQGQMLCVMSDLSLVCTGSE
jgi:hypothetical protein